MTSESISIPTAVGEFHEFLKTTVELCTTNETLWGVPPTKLLAMAPSQVVYENFYSITANKQTRYVAATVARNQMWDKLDLDLRDLFSTCLLNNPAISADDKAALGIKITDSNQKTLGKAPVSTPVTSFSSEEISALHVVFADSNNTDSHAKPHGVGYMEIAAKMSVGEKAPVSVAECTLRYHVSRNHEPIAFEDTDRGKTFFGYSRWVMTNGDSSPWSGMVSAIIP